MRWKRIHPIIKGEEFGYVEVKDDNYNDAM
jgi:hypothetical protein